MAFCTNCGAQLGVGRFCTNCGARVDQEQRPTAAAPHPPPTAQGSPQVMSAPPGPPPPFPPRPPAPAPATTPTSHRQRRSPFSPLLIAVLVVALAGSAVLGALLVTSGSDDGSPGADPTGSPTAIPSEGATPTPPESDVNDVSTSATVAGPPPIPPGQDLAGNPVTYPASNMLDDDPASAYRLPRDATGSVITFQLADVTTISQVGLVNGYTKIDTSGAGTVDWYPLNRRITRVEWSFDDGTTIEQSLDPDVRELQLIEVDDVETGSVQLTILEVSPPGTGPGARDATAISEVLFIGS